MTYKEQYENHKTWQERVIIMNLFHCLHVANRKKWRMVDTANYFGVSLALVSENLQLADKIDECKKFEHRNDALKFLRQL